jgi:hypothetical protein
VLKRHDIAAHVILCMPKFVEIFTELEPSFSRLKVQRDEHGMTVAVRSKLADYGGDKAAQRRDLEATAGMVSAMAEMLAAEAMAMIQLTEAVDGAIGAEHTPIRPVVRPPGRKQ